MVNFGNNVSCQNVENLPKRVKFINNVITEYWERWRREYVLALRQQQRYKRQAGAKTPNVNDIVLIYQEKQPRQLWRLGRIVELIKSGDNEVRQAKVIVGKTKNIIDRPINRLYPLEMSNEVLNIDDGEPKVEEHNIRQKRNAAVIGEIKRKFNV